MNKIFSCLLLSRQPDDHSLVADALRPEISHLQIRQVTDAQAWQQALAAGDFDLGIIADPPPRGDQATLLQDWKSRFPECPVIMLAGPEEQEAAWAALRAGLDDYILRRPEHLARFCSVVQDARHRARKNLSPRHPEEGPRAEGDFYRSIFLAAHEVILVHDPETGRILDANQEACDSFGYTLEDFKNLDLGTLSMEGPGFSQKEVGRYLKKTLQEGPQSFEWLGRDISGKPLWLEITSKPLLIGGQTRVASFGRNISDYKRTQEALREAEDRYETLLDNSGDAIFIHDTAGRLLQVNDAACKLLGYTRSQLQQMTLKDIDAPHYFSIKKKIRDSQERGQVFMETSLQRWDKTTVPVELSSRLIEYSGLPVVFSITRDITERKEAEENLRQKESKYRSIFETTGAATCIDEGDTTLCLVNDEFARLAGYTREELEGKKSWAEFIVPADLDSLKEYHRLRRTDPQAAPRNLSFRFMDRQGQVKDILATVALIPGTNKTVASLLDITARQRAEKALRESEVRYRLLVETMNDGLGMVNEKGLFTFVSCRLCEIIGYSKEELLNRPLKDFLDAANKKIFKEQIKLRKQGGRQPYEITWIRKDGTPVAINVSPVPLFDAGDRFKGSFAVVADITARLQTERALRESEAKYRAIFENSGTSMAIIDEDHIISLVNDEFARLSGYSQEELEGKKRWMEFAAAEDMPKMQEYHRLRRLDPCQAPRNYEAGFIDRQGQRKDMLVTAGMIPGTSKSVGSLLDITARIKAEQDLIFERKKFQTLTENSPLAMVMVGEDGLFRYVNPKFTELFGYDPADVPDGKTWFRKAFPAPAYRHEVIATWVKDLEKAEPGEKRSCTYTVTCKDGAQKIVSFIHVQLDNGDHLMTCEDITARHLAAEAVKRSEQHFRLLIENSMFHLRIIEPDGTIRYESPTLDRFLGYQPAEQEGFNAFDFVHPDDQAQTQEKLRELLENPGMVAVVEMRYRHKDGTWRYLDVKGRNLLQNPIINGIVLNGRDITEEKKAIEALRQSEERYRAMVEDQTEMVSRFLPDGTLTFVNETMCRYLGKSREELIGRSFFPFIPTEDRVVVQRSIAALNRETPFATLEHPVLMPDGREVWQQWTNRAIIDDLGQIIEFHGVGRDITERKRAEEALQESEKLHASILDAMPDMVYELSLDGHLLYANQATAEILGYAPAELPRLTLEHLLDEEGLQKAFRTIGEMVEKGQPSRTEHYQLRTAQGNLVPIETHAILVERSNQPTTVVGVARDITTRLHAEQVLRQTEAEKSLILANMSEMVTYRHRDGRILWANQAAALFYGLTPEQLVGRFCHDIFQLRSTPCPDCPVHEAIAFGQAMEKEIITTNGQTLLLRTSPVKDNKGEVQGTVVVASDITARKKMEGAIKASEEKMRLIIESSPVGVRIIQDDRYLYANPALVGMFGYGSAAEIVGQPATMLFAGNVETRLWRREASLEEKSATASYEVQGVKKDGSRLEAQVWQTEIDYQGEPALLNFVLDVSEAKALRSQLLQSQKMEAIGTLAGGIAHDFNNILFPILVNAEMVLEDLPPDSSSQKRLERVLKACERARDLVKQILAFSRHEERELTPVHLVPIIKDSLRLLRASLPSTIEMRRTLDLANDILLADVTQIQQIVINLYTNAAHAMRDRRGLIEISLTEVGAEVALPPDLGPGPYLQLTVKDNGHGMDPATMDRIFDPYFTTKQTGEGTGLGLAVVHGIVKRHGGAITVASEPGKGSSFHVFLPRADEEIRITPREFPRSLQGQGRILLVDDEPEVIATLQPMLEQLGYRVVALSDSMEALDTFRDHPEDFDLVITDQTMPQLTGKDLALEILSLRPELPVILCTGYSETISREKAQALGIREFVIKPVATQVLAETIQRVLMSQNNGS